jgi:orotate phosphoribosyltransferase
MQDSLIDLMNARTGHFLLESGHHGDLWLDLDTLFLRPHRLRRFIGELASQLCPYGIDAVCGPLTGGAFVAQMIASELDVEFSYAERVAPPRRDGLYAVGYCIPQSLCSGIRGKHVAIVDDVINAGSAIRGTSDALRSCGASTVAIGALLVLGTSAADFAERQNIPLERIAYLESVVWAPSECPLCASGVPLESLAGPRERDFPASQSR